MNKTKNLLFGILAGSSIAIGGLLNVVAKTYISGDNAITVSEIAKEAGIIIKDHACGKPHYVDPNSDLEWSADNEQHNDYIKYRIMFINIKPMVI